MTRNDPHAIEALLVVAWLALMAACTLARALLLPVVALLLAAARWRPAPAPIPRSGEPPIPQVGEPQSPDQVMTPPPAALQALTVAHLRRLARTAGLPHLARRGRRSELLTALAGLEVAACS